jgi:tRNA pseudouridine55 synthase
MQPLHGLLVLDKPAGITSRDAVDRALRWFPRRTRVGHTGTLDPLATGVLVLCVGMATRLTEYVQRMAKTYRTGLHLGARSDTDDADGTIQPVADAPVPDRAKLTQAVGEFIGAIEQVPPAFSAAKVSGRRAYDLARQGDEVALSSRRVHVHGIDILAYEYPRLELEVRCGKGTYIRSLARDLGERLGCGAYVDVLRRTRVGPFDAAEALGLDADAATARSQLLPVVAAVSELPHLVLSTSDIIRLQHGRAIPLPDDALQQEQVRAEAEVAVLTEGNALGGIGVVDRTQKILRPSKMFSV